MDQLNSTTHHQKGKHLTYIEDRFFNDDISMDACVGEAVYYGRVATFTR